MTTCYCRISSTDQNLALLRDTLKREGCEMVFEVVISGTKPKRPGLSEVIEYARNGDCIVVMLCTYPNQH
jgi:DNA invertase Pin-like site-specific DNA recombinase